MLFRSLRHEEFDEGVGLTDPEEEHPLDDPSFGFGNFGVQLRAELGPVLRCNWWQVPRVWIVFDGSFACSLRWIGARGALVFPVRFKSELGSRPCLRCRPAGDLDRFHGGLGAHGQARCASSQPED